MLYYGLLCIFGIAFETNAIGIYPNELGKQEVCSEITFLMFSLFLKKKARDTLETPVAQDTPRLAK